MKILVINGSPKGKYSISLQTLEYLKTVYSEHIFEVLHAGQMVKALERDFTKARASVETADLIVFSYPVYTFLAPSQLHRFIELLKESGIDLAGKFVTQFTTSKHFYDVTAHRYIQDNCQDMGMKFIKGLSADMDDLLTEKGQQDARAFFEHTLWCMEHDVYETNVQEVTMPKHLPIHIPQEEIKHADGDVLIVTNCAPEDTQLQDMITRFRKVLPIKSRVFNIKEYDLKGGCLGCFNCAVSGKCIYKDSFDEYLRKEIQTAQAIVYAFSIKDHSMGSDFKMYDDRNFCNGHRTVTMGMPLGYLVSGDLSKEFNLQMVIEARSQVGGNYLAGIATDEVTPNEAIDKLAKDLCYALEHKLVLPQNFYGIGGMKIFRDLIWLMQGMMKADHKFYKAHGQYDFPQKKMGTMLKMYLIGALISNPKIKAKMGNAMNEGMIAPYKKILEIAIKGK